MALRKISKYQLVEMIEDLDLSDRELKKYLLEDPENSSAFDIAFKADAKNIRDLNKSDRGLLGSLNKRSRRKRYKAYRKKIDRGFKGTRIVSEGDSWFQYPIFLKDIIDRLSRERDFAIRSLGYGGDWLTNIFREREYMRAIQMENPHCFLISGGGNDLIGNGQLPQLIRPYHSYLQAPEYLNREADRRLRQLGQMYLKMFTNLTKTFPKLHIFCHGYDYILPDDEKWVGEPLDKMGIRDVKLQKQIMQEMIDRFNEELKTASVLFDRVHYIDLRGTLPSKRSWKNELHPKNAGFRRIARRFEKEIRETL